MIEAKRLLEGKLKLAKWKKLGRYLVLNLWKQKKARVKIKAINGNFLGLIFQQANMATPNGPRHLLIDVTLTYIDVNVIYK